MVMLALVATFALLSELTHPYPVDGTTGIPMVSAAEPSEEVWAEMTVIKTHYDCRGYPMWREVSKIKSRAGEDVEVLRSSKENYDAKQGNSAASVKPVSTQSRKSRLRIATLPVSATTDPAPRPSATPLPWPLGRDPVVVEPNRVIDTPVISCPEGYNEDYKRKCRPVFPDYSSG